MFEDDLKSGDLERAAIEWRSLLSLIAQGPVSEDLRWTELQVEARRLVGKDSTEEELPLLPSMPARQRERFKPALSASYGLAG